MEAISLHGYSVDQQISTQKSSNPNNNPFILSSRKYVDHILPPPPSQYNFHNMRIVQPPHDNTILSRSSYPPPYSAQLPPILPLPTTAHRHGAAATINRGLSFPPTPHRKPTKSKKKPKSLTNIKTTTNSAKKAITNNDSPLKHDPLSLTKATTGNCCGNKSQNTGSRVKVDDDRYDNVIFSGAVAFAISPPPSSLPLPTFSLRPKLSCKADASCGIDNGASSDLRRLLRLR